MRRAVREGETVVVKVGSSSLTGTDGRLSPAILADLCRQVADLRAHGRRAVVVSSGAIAAGLPVLGFSARPRDIGSQQAAAAVGQGILMHRYAEELAARGLVGAQVLLTTHTFADRVQYLNARTALDRLLALGAVPIVNENDTVVVDEIRFGDNDHLAALVAHLVGANLLVLLTDTPGLYTANPTEDAGATLIEEVLAVDRELEAVAGDSRSAVGTGGMASKVQAAKIATWSGVPAVIAAAGAPDVILRCAAGEAIGTWFRPHDAVLSARRLWIAFALPAAGRVEVDAGARHALAVGKRSLLAAGVKEISGSFQAGDAVEVWCGDETFAKGLARLHAPELARVAGRRSEDVQVILGPAAPGEVIHRDDLVVFR